MKKKKHLKIFAASSLAIFMGIGTLCGVLISPMNSTSANMGATSASNAGDLAASAQSPDRAQSEGLITPKEDDPVIFTTDYGLDIKFGISTPSVSTSLSSGGLKGFPYFTTGSYTWVLIGTGFTGQYTLGDPAAVAIGAERTKEQISFSTLKVYSKDLKATQEIPLNHALCLSNTIVETCQLYNGGIIAINSVNRTFIGGDNILSNKCRTYYTSDTFGFGNYKSFLQCVPLKQKGYYVNSGGSALAGSTTDVISLYFFPLGCTEYDNFRWQTYLTASQWTTTADVWGRTIRTGTNSGWVRAVGTRTTADGTVAYGADTVDDKSVYVGTGDWPGDFNGVRPACVISLY